MTTKKLKQITFNYEGTLSNDEIAERLAISLVLRELEIHSIGIKILYPIEDRQTFSNVYSLDAIRNRDRRNLE